MPIRGILLILLIAVVYGIVFRNQLAAWWNSMKVHDENKNDVEEDDE